MSLNAPHCPTCDVCGAALTVHERVSGDTCQRPSCKSSQLRKRLRQESDEREIIEQQADACRELAADRLDVDPVQLPLGIVPSNDRPLVTLPESRRRKFRDRLLQKISEAAARRYGRRDPESDENDEIIGIPTIEAPHQLAIIGQTCATCRGQCCWQGGDHAFIHVETIERYMEDHPDQRPRDVFDAYMSRVGTKTYRDACVYQDRTGCRLPREMRSQICNDYICRGLSRLLYQLDHAPDAEHVVVVATEGTDVVRATLTDGRQREDFEPPQTVENATGENATGAE